MIMGQSETLMDDVEFRSAAGNTFSPEYTYRNRGASMAIDEACGAWCTVIVTEAFNNIDTLAVDIQHRIIIGGSLQAWTSRRVLATGAAPAALTLGKILFDGQISAPLGETADAGTEVLVRIKATTVGSSTPTTGKLRVNFANEAGMGSDDGTLLNGQDEILYLRNADAGIAR